MPDDAGVGNRLFSETPDLASDFDRKSGTTLFGFGGPIPGDRDSDSCHSVMCTSPPDPGGDAVSSRYVLPVLRNRFTIIMIIVTFSQSDLSGSRRFALGNSCRKFVSESSHRKFVPGVCAGNCAEPSGGPSFVIRVVLFAFVAARVQFNPRGPGCVTTPAYGTPDPAQPQSDVIQLCPSSSGSGLSTLLSSAVMFISPVSALLRWDFVC